MNLVSGTMILTPAHGCVCSIDVLFFVVHIHLDTAVSEPVFCPPQLPSSRPRFPRQTSDKICFKTTFRLRFPARIARLVVNWITKCEHFSSTQNQGPMFRPLGDMSYGQQSGCNVDPRKNCFIGNYLCFNKRWLIHCWFAVRRS